MDDKEIEDLLKDKGNKVEKISEGSRQDLRFKLKNLVKSKASDISSMKDEFKKGLKGNQDDVKESDVSTKEEFSNEDTKEQKDEPKKESSRDNSKQTSKKGGKKSTKSNESKSRKGIINIKGIVGIIDFFAKSHLLILPFIFFSSYTIQLAYSTKKRRIKESLITSVAISIIYIIWECAIKKYRFFWLFFIAITDLILLSDYYNKEE